MTISLNWKLCAENRLMCFVSNCCDKINGMNWDSLFRSLIIAKTSRKQNLISLSKDFSMHKWNNFLKFFPLLLLLVYPFVFLCHFVDIIFGAEFSSGRRSYIASSNHTSACSCIIQNSVSIQIPKGLSIALDSLRPWFFSRILNNKVLWFREEKIEIAYLCKDVGLLTIMWQCVFEQSISSYSTLESLMI